MIKQTILKAIAELEIVKKAVEDKEDFTIKDNPTWAELPDESKEKYRQDVLEQLNNTVTKLNLLHDNIF